MRPGRPRGRAVRFAARVRSADRLFDKRPALLFSWDMQAHLEKLHVQIAECEMIRDLATDPAKRELFARLAEHFKVLVSEVETGTGYVLGLPACEE
jgi:hypothetical protein